MANISVTNSFTNGTTADASQVNQNFTDIINGTSDGTKDFSINALTCAGTATLNGHVNLGNSSSDDLSITASLASTLAIKTNTTYSIGGSTLGLQYAYFGGTSTYTARVGAATLTASRLYTIPEVSADASFVMTQGTQTISGTKTFDGQLIGKGTATNDSASTGYIGECTESTVAVGSAVTLTTATAKTVTSISLTAGDWEVHGIVNFLAAAITGTQTLAGIGQTNNSLTGLTRGDNRVESPQVPTSAADKSLVIPGYRLSLSGTTTIYLIAYATFSAGTLTCNGRISARRCR